MRREIVDATDTYTEVRSKRKMSSMAVISYIIAFGVSMVFVLIAVGIGVSRYRSSKICTEKVMAVVNENRFVEREDSSPTYVPIFEYTFNGVRYLTKSNTSSDPPEFEEGQEVEIFVDPDDPAHIYVPDDKTLFFLIGIFCLIGMVGVIITAIVLVIHRVALNKPDKVTEERYY